VVKEHKKLEHQVKEAEEHKQAADAEQKKIKLSLKELAEEQTKILQRIEEIKEEKYLAGTHYQSLEATLKKQLVLTREAHENLRAVKKSLQNATEEADKANAEAKKAEAELEKVRADIFEWAEEGREAGQGKDLLVQNQLTNYLHLEKERDYYKKLSQDLKSISNHNLEDLKIIEPGILLTLEECKTELREAQMHTMEAQARLGEERKQWETERKKHDISTEAANEYRAKLEKMVEHERVLFHEMKEKAEYFEKAVREREAAIRRLHEHEPTDTDTKKKEEYGTQLLPPELEDMQQIFNLLLTKQIKEILLRNSGDVQKTLEILKSKENRFSHFFRTTLIKNSA